MAGEPFVMLPYPVGVNRVWRQARGRVIPNPDALIWKQTAAGIFKGHGFKPEDGPFFLHYKLHPRMNRDGSASDVRLDIDAPAKALLDALTGVVWLDDKQVVRLVGELAGPVRGGGLSVRVVPCA